LAVVGAATAGGSVSFDATIIFTAPVMMMAGFNYQLPFKKGRRSMMTQYSNPQQCQQRPSFMRLALPLLLVVGMRASCVRVVCWLLLGCSVVASLVRSFVVSAFSDA
jgi:hypothetical protein